MGGSIVKKVTYQNEMKKFALHFAVPRVYDNAKNTGDDNSETVKLVRAAYESANTGKAVGLNDF